MLTYADVCGCELTHADVVLGSADLLDVVELRPHTLVA